MTNETNLELPPPEAAGQDQQHRSGGTGGARQPLRRHDGILGGVATGLADYFRLAPWLIRLAFVVLSFFGGLGILLYLAGWLVIPAEGADDSIVEGWLAELGTGRSLMGAALIALAAIWLLTSLDIARSGLAWAVALLVLGVLLYRGEIPRNQIESNEATLTEDPIAAPAAPSTPGTPAPRRLPSRRQPRPRRPRPSSMLGRYTFAAGLIGIGILALLENAGVLFPDARHYLALAVAIVGAGLLVGSVWGRSRMMIVAGLFLAFLMGVATIGNAVDAFTDEVRTYAPAIIGDVATSYTMESGTLILDLTKVDWQNREIDIDADLGAGQLEIKLPEDVTATVNARAGVGQIEIFGRTSEGLGVGRSTTVKGQAGAGNITLSVRVGAGQITVYQENNS
ncbi:MAG: PspC domain-containing protein [Acidimicrobiia bacterium]|nr:PspC domain-containing protein [Acidimicrobiia bacterium]